MVHLHWTADLIFLRKMPISDEDFYFRRSFFSILTKILTYRRILNLFSYEVKYFTLNLFSFLAEWKKPVSRFCVLTDFLTHFYRYKFDFPSEKSFLRKNELTQKLLLGNFCGISILRFNVNAPLTFLPVWFVFVFVYIDFCL